ncbi:MAG TPA: GntR family transcriptional regulator [Hyphomicrobiales bacterium]|nr:GntR family transcriptional regulator [Hyphomicrobiales bacterium]
MTDRESLATRRKRSRDDAGKADVPLRQAAYERIEDLLNNGVLRPGQIITQRELVEMTGTTLGSVREAVPRFEAEGLLQTLPQRGLMVPSLDIIFVRDAYQMRRVIELAAVPDMVVRLSRDLIAEWIDWHRSARSRIQERAGASSEDLSHEIQHRDWDMHESFVSTMRNKLIANVYRVTAIKIRMVVQSRIQVTRYNATRIINEHLGILEPLHKGDVGGTQAALARHLDNSLKIALGGTVDDSETRTQ